MSKPSGSIKQVHLPTDATGVNHDIIPDAVGNGNYKASCPTLSADATLALTSDLPVIEIGGSSSSNATELTTLSAGSYVWKSHTYIKVTLNNASRGFYNSDVDDLPFFLRFDRSDSAQNKRVEIFGPLTFSNSSTAVYSATPEYISLYNNYASVDFTWKKCILGKVNDSYSAQDFYAPTSAGTSGQILQSNGSGAPTWVNASSGGGVTLRRWS